MKNRERSREILYWIGAGVSWLVLLLLLVGDKLGLELPRVVGGLLAGAGGALGGLLTVKALFARYYRRNEKARRAAEREEKDERNQMLRGIAAHRVMLATPHLYHPVGHSAGHGRVHSGDGCGDAGLSGPFRDLHVSAGEAPEGAVTRESRPGRRRKVRDV